MLMIQVLGKGLIPRGHGLAPKLEPFPASLKLIGTILSTNGLSVKFIHPVTGVPTPLNRENYQHMFKKYANKRYQKPAVKKEEHAIIPQHHNVNGVPQAVGMTVVVDDPTPQTTIPPVVLTDKPIETPKEENKQEFSMKPILAPEDKSNGKNNQNNNRHQNNNHGK